MEALWRWTSSVFLLLALNIGCTKSQNVGANCPLPPQTLQGEILRDSNPCLANPLLQMNSLFSYPSNGLAPGEACALECQRQAIQDRTPLSLRQQANVPQNPCATLLSNGLNPQSGSLSVPNLPGTLLVQNQCPIAPLGTPYLPQENAVLEALPTPQGQFLPLGILPGKPPLLGPLTPFNSAPNIGIDIWPGPQQGPSCTRLDTSSNIVPNLGNHFTTLVPVKSGSFAPCLEVLPLQRALPPNQGLSPINQPIPPFIPLNNQGVPIDAVNCLPQATGPQCDVSLETPPCPASVPQCPPAVGTSLQNVLPFPQFNMFKLPRPALFEPPYQGPLTNTLQNVNAHYPPTQIQNTPQIQQEPICQYPLPPAYLEPNTLTGLSSNFQPLPLQQPAVSQLSLSSNPCAFTTVAPDFMPSPLCQTCPPNGFAISPQVTDSTNCLPPTSNVFTSCINGGLPSVLPNAFLESNIDNSRFCHPGITEASPTPINLQINVPPPVIPAPRITIINATPAPEAPVSTAATGSSFFDFPYSMPPMIIEGGRSSSRSWLPLILVALFAGDGDFGGYGGACNSDPIPIPYPIAIPTNNPVVVK